MKKCRVFIFYDIDGLVSKIYKVFLLFKIEERRGFLNSFVFYLILFSWFENGKLEMSKS